MSLSSTPLQVCELHFPNGSNHKMFLYLSGELVIEYRKNNKCNKIPDLEKEEAKKGPEMSAKIAKVKRIFHAS